MFMVYEGRMFGANPNRDMNHNEQWTMKMEKGNSLEQHRLLKENYRHS